MERRPFAPYQIVRRHFERNLIKVRVCENIIYALARAVKIGKNGKIPQK